jgi:NADH-quinone oxidoreductase subunit F
MPIREVLTKDILTPGLHELKTYERLGGYQALRKALKEMTPDQVSAEVKKSQLKGRGGAAFPTAQKWSFLPKDVFPRYLCCNADESEPGCFKDRYLMEHNPHQLIEGIILASYAIQCNTAFAYVRGEYLEARERVEAAVQEAWAAGYLGKNILGTDYSLDLLVHGGAGAYICGEETALLTSLEGYRGEPRLKPPFYPTAKGLYGQPTVVNNVETLSSIPHIVGNGGDWWASIGPATAKGPRIMCVSGHVERPGNYEIVMGDTTVRELIYDICGGVWKGRKLKAFQPGGGSMQVLTEQHLDIGVDFESLQKAGSSLGAGGLVVMDETVCMVDTSMRLVDFYHHESCGKCTPCREGTYWMSQILHRLEAGEGAAKDLPLLQQISKTIDGRSFCFLGDTATWFLGSAVKYFPDEFEAHAAGRTCTAQRATVPA